MGKKFDIALSFAMENVALVEKVYRYLKAENIAVFFAPSSEAQVFLSGKNQSEVFYRVFGMDAKYVALFVSKDYIIKRIPMEEAHIAFAKHAYDNSVIPVYLDDTMLPTQLFDPQETNYFKSDDPAVIASHLVSKIKNHGVNETLTASEMPRQSMHISGNKAETQIFIQTINGGLNL